MRSHRVNTPRRSVLIAAAAVMLGASPAFAEEDKMPQPSNHIESKGIGEWADLTIEEHVLKAVIEGASRGPAPDQVSRIFQQKTRSVEPVEVRAERQHKIKGRPGCASVNLYFHQEGVPMYRPGDTSFEEPVKHVPFEVRYEMERCADGNTPEPRLPVFPDEAKHRFP